MECLNSCRWVSEVSAPTKSNVTQSAPAGAPAKITA
jgi:hypothetical protein